MDLLKQVISEQNKRKGDWPQIDADNVVSYSWLSKLAQRKIPDPGINKIVRLYDYLFQNTEGVERRRSPGRREADFADRRTKHLKP